MHTMSVMSDDEFFSFASAAGPLGPTLSRHNPLTLYEVKIFSRKLLNIVFALYSREEVGEVGVEEAVVGRWTWESIRETVEKCLIGIHARE
jgi:ubiquitin-protein ligase E3 C